MSGIEARDIDVYRVPYYVEKYRTTRHSVTDLFKSERYFLPRCLSPNYRVLDVGCACGGFFNILRTLEPTIDYCGSDLSEALLFEARRLYPQGLFSVADATNLPWAAGSFDLVQAWGVTLHEPEYRKVISEAWRVTCSKLLFDVRLQRRGHETADKEFSFVLNPGGIRNFYIVPNAIEFVRFITELEPLPGRIEIFGYEGVANQYVTLPEGTLPIYMTGVALFKERRVEGIVDFEVGLPEPLLSDVNHEISSQDRFVFRARTEKNVAATR